MRMGRTLLPGKSIKILAGLLTAAVLCHCGVAMESNEGGEAEEDIAKQVLPAIQDFSAVLAEIGDRKVGVVTNHTGMIGETHLVDTLMASRVGILRVFAPEHGFRGDVPDGERISDGRDPQTGLEIISLYGSNKKPDPKDLTDIELMLFDIQDVGVRFYTYLSTLHYVMEACAEADIPLVVLDRPNPNIHRLDGPVLLEKFKSFVGMHPVPVAYGMTIGEYARMINGEGWLDSKACDLKVLPCLNYRRSDRYQLPVKPSPNLPDMESIYLYPSLCFFEGTNVSVGRGTEKPFTVIGEPGNAGGDFTFTPVPVKGASLHPKHEGIECRGYDLSDYIDMPSTGDTLNLAWLLRMFRESPDRDHFFLSNGYFDKLAGTDALRLAILDGHSIRSIRASWQKDLDNFETIRRKYLIYSN